MPFGGVFQPEIFSYLVSQGNPHLAYLDGLSSLSAHDKSAFLFQNLLETFGQFHREKEKEKAIQYYWVYSFLITTKLPPFQLSYQLKPSLPI